MVNEQVNKENPLGTEPVGGLLRRYAIPSIVAMLVGALYNIVDQFFIGQKIGELGNAATNVAFPLSTACVAIALLLELVVPLPSISQWVKGIRKKRSTMWGMQR